MMRPTVFAVLYGLLVVGLILFALFLAWTEHPHA